MARDIQLAVAAAERAFLDAGLVGGKIDPTRIGVDLGAGLISSELRPSGRRLWTAIRSRISVFSSLSNARWAFARYSA